MKKPHQAARIETRAALWQNDRLHHRHFGAGVVQRIRDGGILDIDFAGTVRSIRIGVAALERRA